MSGWTGPGARTQSRRRPRRQLRRRESKCKMQTVRLLEGSPCAHKRVRNARPLDRMKNPPVSHPCKDLLYVPALSRAEGHKQILTRMAMPGGVDQSTYTFCEADCLVS